MCVGKLLQGQVGMHVWACGHMGMSASGAGVHCMHNACTEMLHVSNWQGAKCTACEQLAGCQEQFIGKSVTDTHSD